jgi:hypothetical protein
MGDSGNQLPSGDRDPVKVVLRKWHREELFDLVEAAGLDPATFDLDEDDGESRLRHLVAGSYFAISRAADGTYTVRYVAGDGPLEDRDGLSWYRLKQRVEAWLREVRTDLEMPDRWAELRRAREILFVVPGDVVDNTPFSSEEKAAIERQLREFRELAKDRWSLSGERLATLDANVDYLVDAVDRLGRFDWRNAFAGAFIGLLLTAVFPPESVREVLVMLVHSVTLILGN